MNEVDAVQEKMVRKLEDSLSDAVAIITRNYLERLERCEIQEPSWEDTDIDIASCGSFYRLKKLVINREENFLDKLVTIVNVVSSIGCSLVTIIHSDGSSIDYYLGILSKGDRGMSDTEKRRRAAKSAAFRGALQGNLIGSEAEAVPDGEMIQFRDQIIKKRGNCYAAVSGIAAFRDEKDRSAEGYVQGIENLVDSLKGQTYTIVVLADPVSTEEIQTMRLGYETLHTQLSMFAKSQVTIQESDTLSLSNSRTSGFSESISKGIAMTQSKTNSKGKSFGGEAHIGIGIKDVFSVGGGINAGMNKGTSETKGTTDSYSRNQSYNRATMETASAAKASGKSVQLSYENREVRTLLEKIDKHLERLDACESFGAFDCAAYIIAETRETALMAASNYNALMRGKDSHIQASHINIWDKEEDTKRIKAYLGALVHPRFSIGKGGSKIIVTPSAIIGGNELAIQVGLPKKSIAGVTVISMAPFGRNVAEKENGQVSLGNLYHMGKVEEGSPRVSIDVESLAMHTFITGSTGAGKSNTIYTLLDKLTAISPDPVTYMVIEPAKGEYKNVFGHREGVSVFGTNPAYTKLLRINPFRFPKRIHILEHIDRLIEIFNVCWPMYAAMPAVLKDAVLAAYSACGWDLVYSNNTMASDLYPTFQDLLKQLVRVINESEYSDEVKSNYIGSLTTRVRSLTNGLNGQIFSSNELDNNLLFDSNVIVDLSRIGSQETKALLMGVLVMRLSEYRMSNDQCANSKLHHVTVLEEAHNILGKAHTDVGPEGTNISGKSVEMLSNAIAEMRTYGEGFIIADQSPGAVDISAIRNTNTKIIMRLPEENDRRVCGKAAALKDNQIDEIARLPRGVAVIYQNDWVEPVLCQVDKFSGREIPFVEKAISGDSLGGKEAASVLINFVAHNRIDDPDRIDCTRILDAIKFSGCGAETKMTLYSYVREYRRRNRLSIWDIDPEEFLRQSRLVTDILDLNGAVESVRNLSPDPVGFTCRINTLIAQKINKVSDALLLTLTHCLLKAYSEGAADRAEFFEKWVEKSKEGRYIV